MTDEEHSETAPVTPARVAPATFMSEPASVYEPPWWAPSVLLSSLDTGKLALGAAIWYGFLWITYNRFYEPLGISPSDVGLNYANILANSVGAAVTFLVPVAVLVMALLSLAVLVRSFGYRRGFNPSRLIYVKILRNLLVTVALLVVGLLVYVFPVRAANAADQVKQGEAVSPLHFLMSPAPVLAVQANRVISIKPASPQKTGETTAIASLPRSGLLYMGQANGVIVLFDSSERQAHFIPSSSVLLTVEKEP